MQESVYLCKHQFDKSVMILITWVCKHYNIIHGSSSETTTSKYLTTLLCNQSVLLQRPATDLRFSCTAKVLIKK